MESETENLGTTSELTSEDTSSSDALTSTGVQSKKKKGKKKSEGGSDLAFFACFPCMVIAAVTIVLTVLGFLPIGPVAWFSEFCASLRAQFVIILLLCVLPALFAPQLRLPMVIGCGLGVLINFACVVPAMIPKPEPPKEIKELTFVNFRILQLSVEDPEAKVEPIVEQINNSKAEVVCVTGIPGRTLIKLNEAVPAQFIYRAFFSREDGYAQAVYSTVPLKGTRLKKIGPERLPVVCTSIHFDWGWFRVVMVKLPEPTDGAALEKRNEQMKAVAQLVKPMDGRKIVLGNFNTSPYSMAFGDFLKETDLVDSRIGVQPNWNLGPVDILGVLHIPVDHIFVNKSVGVLSRSVYPTEGLTHQPLCAQFYPADRNAVLYKEEAAGAEDDDEAETKPAAKPAATSPAATPDAPADDKKAGKRKKKGK